MWIIIQTIPEDGSDYIVIRITEGDSAYIRCMATEYNIYVKNSWKEVEKHLEPYNVQIPKYGKSIEIEVWILSGKNIVRVIR